MNQLSVASVCTLSAELHSSLQETIISRKLQTYALSPQIIHDVFFQSSKALTNLVLKKARRGV